MAASMNMQPVTARIHDHLKDAGTRQRLKARFASAREQLTTTIGEAAKLANVSAEKARYAETVGILSSSRSDETKGTAAHRRYRLDELHRLIVISDLIDHEFTMAEIAQYLRQDHSSVDTLVKSLETSNATTRLRDAETAYCQRMLIPRLLYFAQCLLLGDVVDCSMALVLPIARDGYGTSDPPLASDSLAEDSSEDSSEAAPTRNLPLTSVEDLPQIGPSLVGWRLRRHPYCVLYMPAPRMDDETRYEMRSVDEICRDAGVEDVDERPTGAYLLIEREFAHLLAAPTLNRPRVKPETLGGDSDKPRPNPRAVAYRLLRMLRLPADEASNTFGHNFASDGDGMIYNSPEFAGNLTEDRLLTEITELVVRLGNADEAGTSSGRGRWLFAAVLLPDDLSLPSSKQSLVVTVQSEKSPHIPGSTRLSPGSNAGLSTAAALSGHMLLRRVMDSPDAAIADAGLEGEPGPALALPMLSTFGRVLAVLYVRARSDEHVTVNDTFTPDDQLMLRIIGHIIGGIVFGYHGSHLAGKVFSDMMARPQNVDIFFQEFAQANEFWQDLEKTLGDRAAMTTESSRLQESREVDEPSETQSSTSVQPLTVFAIDIDGYTNVINTYGANTARHLVRAVGKRIAQKIKLTSIPSQPTARRRAHLYYIYGDRFYLMLGNVSGAEAQTYAIDLQRLLKDDYIIEVTRTNGSRSVSAGTAKIEDIGASIVIISYDGAQLRDLLIPDAADEPVSFSQPHDPMQSLLAVVSGALDAGIIQAKQTGKNTILYLDTEKGAFMRVRASVNDMPQVAQDHLFVENAGSSS